MPVEVDLLPRLARAMPAGLATWHTRGEWQPARHHLALNQALLEVAAGRSKRLMVIEPPQHGKSTQASRYFPAWLIGSQPKRRVNLVSYEAGWAKTHGRAARDILVDSAEIFPATRVREDVDSAGDWMTTQGGGMFSTGIGGPLTGRGGDLIVDDPTKNAEEAFSETIQERNDEWYRSTARTRVGAANFIIWIQTRWSELDTAQRILDREGTAADGTGPWVVLHLPAIAEEGDPIGRQPGEALWPERYPLSELNAIRAAIGPSWFASLYQGRPGPREGALFKRAWFRYYRRDDAGGVPRFVLQDGSGATRVFPVGQCRFFGVADTAQKEREQNSYTVLSSWALTAEHDLLWLGMWREHVETTQLERMTEDFWRSTGPGVVLHIEEKQSGTGLIQSLKAKGRPIAALQADADKVTRARLAEARYSVGKIFHPEPAAAPWISTAEGELLLFPKGKHNDIVDNVAYAARLGTVGLVPPASAVRAGTRVAPRGHHPGDLFGRR